MKVSECLCAPRLPGSPVRYGVKRQHGMQFSMLKRSMDNGHVCEKCRVDLYDMHDLCDLSVICDMCNVYYLCDLTLEKNIDILSLSWPGSWAVSVVVICYADLFMEIMFVIYS